MTKAVGYILLTFYCCFLIPGDVVRGQWPLDCVTSEGTLARTCCPDASNGLRCGGAGRGSCEYIEPSTLGDDFKSYDFYWLDDRVAWPSKFYDYGCACVWPFQGGACDECVWGYYGDECQEYKMITRVNILSDAELGMKTMQYISWSKGNISNYAIRYLSHDMMVNKNEGNGDISEYYYPTSYFDFFSWMHEYATSPFYTMEDCTYAHKGPALFTFHRHMMLLFERMLQKVSGDEDFALPYWDWIGVGNDCAVCTDELFGRNLNNGTLVSGLFNGHEWTNRCESMLLLAGGVVCGNVSEPITRAPGTNPDAAYLPSEAQLDGVMDWDIYEISDEDGMSFRPAAEGTCNPVTGDVDGINYMHSMAHTFFGVNATMALSPPSDPIFYVFHSYYDKVYEQWVQKWGRASLDTYPLENVPIGHSKDAYIVPFFPVVKNSVYLDTNAKFGYCYDKM